MITGLELKNFKNFTDLVCNFRTRSGDPKHLILIYGDSGIGKTTFVEAFHLLLTLMLNSQALTIPWGNPLLRKYCGRKIDEPTSIKVYFRFDGTDGHYFIEFNQERILREELRHKIDQRAGVIFTSHMNRAVLHRRVIYHARTRTVMRRRQRCRRGKESTFSCVNKFRKKSTDLKRLSAFFRSYWVTCEGHMITREKMDFTGDEVDSYSRQLVVVNCPKITAYMKAFFPMIKHSYYVQDKTQDPPRYEFEYRESVAGKLIPRRLDQAPRSVKRMLELYPWLLHFHEGGGIVIDDIDSATGLQVEQQLRLFKALTEFRHGQLIATISDVSILDLLDTDIVHVLLQTDDGSYELKALNFLPSRTYQQNSIRRKFLRGDYGCNKPLEEVWLDFILR